jgi:hypothetical protein
LEPVAGAALISCGFAGRTRRRLGFRSFRYAPRFVLDAIFGVGSMAIEPEELEEIPPQGHVKVVYTGSVAPHWEIHRVFGDQRAIDEFRQRAMARLQLLPVYDPQFRRNRERVARDAEREHLILEWDLGDEPEG